MIAEESVSTPTLYVDELDSFSDKGRIDVKSNVFIAGTLLCPLKLFRIDHPLDPSNKYLTHSCVESPEMKTIYDGIIKLGKGGEAMVKLPDWFQALNGEFRYQLTPLGKPAPELHIAQKVSNNQFKIAGGAEGMEVCWQVTGIRHDKVAQANRFAAVEDKSGNERGRYLHPTLYGENLQHSLFASLTETERKEKQSRRQKRREENRKLTDGHRHHMKKYQKHMESRVNFSRPD